MSHKSDPVTGLDMSMRGPLSPDEEGEWASSLAKWQETLAAVPQSILAPATLGNWSIERRILTRGESLHLFRKDRRNGSRAVWTPPGPYTYLRAEKPTRWGWPGGDIMHDRWDELRFIQGCLFGASGDVLECGLGLGLFVTAALARPEIASLTVVEIEPDIIDLVGKHFSHPKLRIINADFRTWDPPGKTRYSRVWLDTIAAHNTTEVARKYMGFADDVRFYESDPRA